MFNSVLSSWILEDSDMKPMIYSSASIAANPCNVQAGSLGSGFNCVSGLRSQASRKVLQVLAFVSGFCVALVNVCRLRLGCLQRLLSLVFVKLNLTAMPNVFFSRYHITTGKNTSDKIDFLLTGLRNDARTDFREYVYKFFNSELVQFNGKEFITGQLVKYNPDDVEEVVDASERKLQDEDVKNKVVGKARYIIDPSSSIIMYAEVPGIISKKNFATRFAKLFEENHDNFFTEIFISPIKEQYSFIEKVKSFKALKRIFITLVPSNPNFADRWQNVDERLRSNQISKYKETQENKVTGQSLIVDEETESKFLMSEDGYGESVASGIDADGYERTITTKESNKQVNKNVSVDLDKVTDVLMVVAETLQEIVKRTQK